MQFWLSSPTTVVCISTYDRCLHQLIAHFTHKWSHECCFLNFDSQTLIICVTRRESHCLLLFVLRSHCSSIEFQFKKIQLFFWFHDLHSSLHLFHQWDWGQCLLSTRVSETLWLVDRGEHVCKQNSGGLAACPWIVRVHSPSKLYLAMSTTTIYTGKRPSEIF